MAPVGRKKAHSSGAPPVVAPESAPDGPAPPKKPSWMRRLRKRMLPGRRRGGRKGAAASKISNKDHQDGELTLPPAPEQPSLEEIATTLREEMEVRDRKYRLKTYHECFVGSELVDYLVENGLAPSRPAAVAMGQELMGDLKTFEHVTREPEFQDGYLFYRFTEPETAPNYKKLGSGGGGGIVKMDKYGFLLDDHRAQSHATENGGQLQLSDERRWAKVLEKAPSSKGFKEAVSSQSKVKSYARKGLPDAMRQKAWTVLTGVDLIMAENPGEYGTLVELAEEEWHKMHDLDSAGDLMASVSSNKGHSGGGAFNVSPGGEADNEKMTVSKIGTCLETIERDIHRTFPKHYLFHTKHDDDDGDNGSKMSDSQREISCDDSDAVGSDDEEEGLEDSGLNLGDGIEDIAEATGQDAAEVVEAKKKLFNESLNTLNNTLMNNMACGGLNNVDGIAEGDEGLRESTVTGTSDQSLDILASDANGDEDAVESDGDDEPLNRRSSSKSGKFSAEALQMGHGQFSLRRVLRAYAMYDSEVGYCQGMNFIAATFLTFLSEEEAFWLLVVVMNEEPYKLRDLFGEDMAGTHEVLYIAEKLMAQFLPKLAGHMEAEGIHVSMFVTQWLLTVYTSTFPFDLVARVWDCFLVEGWKVVYRVMLSLLETASRDVLDMRFESVLGYFREFPSTVDGKTIMAGSLKIALKRKHIQKHVKDWRRHAGGGDERANRRNSGDSSMVGTIASLDIRKIAPSNFLKKANAPKEIEIENISEQLLPVLGTSKFAVMLHNVLTPEECSALIDDAEERGFEDASIYDRRNNRAHRNCSRCVHDDPALAENWYDLIVHALRDTVFERKLRSAPWIKTRDNGKTRNGQFTLRAVGINERLRMLKYKHGEFFHSHNDAVFSRGSDQGVRAGEASFVSVQVYLNQNFKGGSTTFHGKGRHLDIKPRTGSVLLFEHGILHSGQTVTHGKKYLIRTDVMYATTYSLSGSVGLSSAASGTTLAADGTTLTQQL
ncbi:hypothetical protein ACHAXT_002148 [Thalassiosira profunda]